MNKGVLALLDTLSVVAFVLVGGYFSYKAKKKKAEALIAGPCIIAVAFCNMFFFNINVNIMVYASVLLTSLWMFMMKKSIDHTDFKKELEDLKSSTCISERYFKLLRHKTFEDMHLIECATFIIVLICTLIFEVPDLVKRILANVPLFFCGVYLIVDFANKKWMEKICAQDEHKLQEN